VSGFMLVLSLLWGITAGAWVYAFGETLRGIWGWFWRSRVPSLLEKRERKPFSLYKEVGLSLSAWLPKVVAAGILGFLWVWLAAGPFFAPLGLLWVLAPLTYRHIKIQEIRWAALKETHRFIVGLWMRLTGLGSLGKAMESLIDSPIAGEGEVASLFWRRLRELYEEIVHTKGGLPEDVLEEMAREWKLTELEEIALAVKEARGGGRGFEKILKRTIEDLLDRMHREAMLSVKQASARMIYPVAVLMFPTVLLMLFLPLFARIMETL